MTIDPLSLGAARMRSTALFMMAYALLAGGLARGTCGTPTAALAGESAPTLQDFIDSVIAPRMATDHVPGAAVAVVRDGELLLAKGYGYADVAAQTPVDANETVFRIGSISKLFTATAVLQQRERGLLTLDEDVRRWLAFDLPRISPLPITLRALLTHTAGFEEGAFGMSEDRAEDLLPLEETLRRTMPRQVRAPGVGISYSNHGVSLAGFIVERSSGLPFSAYVNRYIFAPLAMTHSTFAEPLPARLAPHLAKGYEYEGGAFHEHPFQFVGELAPAGALTTSATDMAHFMMAQLDSGHYAGNDLLSAASVAEMQREQYSISPTHASSVGLVFSRTFRNGTLILSHGGDVRDYVSVLTLLPGAHAGLFASFNSASAGRLVSELPARFIDRYVGKPCIAAVSPKTDAARFAGTYRLSRAVESNFAKVAYLFIEFPVKAQPGDSLSFDGGLFAPSGRNRFAQTAAGPSGREWGELEFFERDGRMQIAFSENPFVSAHRLPVIESSLFMKLALAVAVVYLLLLGLRTLWARIKRQPSTPMLRRQRALAAGAICAVIAFWVGLVAFLIAAGILDTGFGAKVPTILRLLLCLPWVAAALALAGTLATVSLLRSGSAALIDRALAVLFVPLMATVLSLMAYWHVLGSP